MEKDRDWKEVTDYEYLKNLKPYQWAWEFLRRNAEYIREFKELIPEEIKRRKKLLSDPEIGHLKMLDGIRNINPDNPRFSIHINNKNFLIRWGMLYMVNPDNDHPFPNPFRQRVSIENGTLQGGNIAYHNFTHYDIKGDYVPVVFDITRPIKPQIQYAQKRLLEWQRGFAKAIKKNRKETNWIDYIRILDAKVNGTSDRDIASVIYPYVENNYDSGFLGDDRVNKAYKRARYLSEKGYREIAMLY